MKPWVFHLGYGALCLDFANTVSWRGSGEPVDHLQAYDDLIRFARQAKLVSAIDARRLRREARRRPVAHLRSTLTSPHVRQSTLSLAVCRCDAERDAAVVLDGGVREPRQGGSLPPTPAARLTSLGRPPARGGAGIEKHIHPHRYRH